MHLGPTLVFFAKLGKVSRFWVRSNSKISRSLPKQSGYSESPWKVLANELRRLGVNSTPRKSYKPTFGSLFQGKCPISTHFHEKSFQRWTCNFFWVESWLQVTLTSLKVLFMGFPNMHFVLANSSIHPSFIGSKNLTISLISHQFPRWVPNAKIGL